MFKKGYKMTEEHKRKIGLANSVSLIGNKRSEETKLKIRMGMKGEKHHNWKGDDVGYISIHSWVVRWKGKPDTCEKCGKSGLKERRIHWANIDHQYRRVLDDYIRLCSGCHGKFDIERRLRKHNK